ncbi:DNA double-strand break repair rad50 ATPase [Heracleum sosnowskyi]|uniref:DNA double-strand break repair rad50 ATPase n=1 Tax=Heracleum sosnowskyi TaxID=360622 RepID=A0AAD8GUM4_9APIA|nr:DNA double-strand break repair rad50 ATPase [Heracleum sosnowskyi]
MRKQTKSRKSDSVGKGKVTPVQIAFLVDRYLADNNFTNTRSSFRIEASHILSRSPVQEAPKSLMSLGELIDDYIVLKGKKVILDQEKGCVEQENIRVQNLIKGMQDVMNAYNNFGANVAALPQPVLVNSGASVPCVDLTVESPAAFPVSNTQAVMPESRPLNTPATSKNLSTPSTNAATSKRKNSSDYSVTAKRSRIQAPKNLLQTKDTNRQQQNNASNCNLQSLTASPHVNVSGGSVQGSSVAKCLFNQPSKLPPNNSSSPSTPPQAMSTPTVIIASPQETANATCYNVSPQCLTSTNSTLIASETITVSPSKQITYSVERNHRISSSSPMKTDIRRVNTRDHVKGRLDFDESDMTLSTDIPKSWEVSASETGKEVDCLDFDFPNLDAFGPDFNFSELLGEFGLDGDEMNCSFQPVMNSSSGSLSGSPNTPEDASAGANQVISEYSSTVTEVLSEKNMNVSGPDSVTSTKSVTKSIKISSPVKKQRGPSKYQENVSLRNRLL